MVARPPTTKVDGSYDGSTPLNKREEAYCLARASGRSQFDSYHHSHGDVHKVKDATARVAGHRLEKRDYINLRILWHQRQLSAPAELQEFDIPADQPVELTRAGLLRLLDETTTALSSAISSLEAHGSAPQAVARLRSDMIQHVARMGRLEAAPPEAPPQDPHFEAMFREMDKIELCSCAEQHLGAPVRPFERHHG